MCTRFLIGPTSPGQIKRREAALRLHHALWDIFTTLFEPQLGLWIGNDCNPFKRITTAPKTLVSRLVVTLDSARRSVRVDPFITETLRLPAGAQISTNDGDSVEACINQALMSAVHAFASRWLPTEFFGSLSTGQEAAKARFMQTLWQQAHQDVLEVVTKPSYRSILALYLFSITPSMSSSSMHPVSNMCYEASLRHYLQLRLESRISYPRLDEVPTNQGTIHRVEFGHLEDSAYWFGLVCDVSRSLLRCQAPILLSGPSWQARVWSMVSNQVAAYAARQSNLRSSKDVLDDDTVLAILQFGSSCKTMTWAAITDVQDALFHDRMNLDLVDALQFTLDKLQYFENVFCPMLDQCARDFLLLSTKSQLGYVWLVLHFHLGVLLLADTLAVGSATPRPEQQASMANHRLSSTRAVVNVINLVRQYDSSDPDRSSLLLRDPYPEHASNCFSRAARSVLHLAQSGTITRPVATVLAPALFKGLRTISQISFSASESLTVLTTLFQEHGISPGIMDTKEVTFTDSTKSILLDSGVTPDMLESETLEELGQQATADPSLVTKTIERYEGAELESDFGLDYLQWIDFTAVTGDWDFQDCFAGL